MTDELKLATLVEDPDRVEAAYLEEQAAAELDRDRRERLESIYAERRRDVAFSRFAGSRELAAIHRLLSAIPVPKSARIVELGGGAGFLSWALQQHGFRVDLVEPNGHWNTGTGYLESRDDHEIHIWNDLATWYASDSQYDLVLTRNCVHHFPPLPYVAACVRSKVRRGGRWLMLREAFSDSHAETLHRIRRHPYATQYGLYEFFFSPSYYVDGMRDGGWELEAVVPGTYDAGVLESFAEQPPTRRQSAFTAVVDNAIRHAKPMTRLALTAELALGKLIGRPPRRFSRPPALLFRKH